MFSDHKKLTHFTEETLAAIKELAHFRGKSGFHYGIE
jgi:hypothetical protein